jgi:hypothetical protein
VICNTSGQLSLTLYQLDAVFNLQANLRVYTLVLLLPCAGTTTVQPASLVQQPQPASMICLLTAAQQLQLMFSCKAWTMLCLLTKQQKLSQYRRVSAASSV